MTKTFDVFFTKCLWSTKNKCLYEATIKGKKDKINIMLRDQFPPVFPNHVVYQVEGYFHKNLFECFYWHR